MQQLMNRLSGIKTRQKILVGVILPLIMMLIVGGVGIVNIGSIIRSNEQVQGSEEVLASASDVLVHAGDMETGMRGYLLAGKDSFLEPFEGGRRHVQEDLQTLKQLVASDPDKVAAIGQAAAILQKWDEDVAQPSIALRRDIGDAETMNDMAKFVGRAEGKAYFEQFRATIAKFVDIQKQLLDARRERFASSSEKLEDNVAKLQEIYNLLDSSHRQIEHVEMLQASAFAMESDMRGYLLSGRVRDMDRYNKGQKKFLATAKKLEMAFGDRQAEIDLLRKYVGLIIKWDKTVVQTTLALRKQVSAGTISRAQMEKVYTSRMVEATFDKFRSGIENLLAQEEKRLEEISSQRDDAEFEVEGAIVVMKYEESQVTDLHQIVADAKGVLEAAINMETGMRGYLLAGKSGFIAPYQDGRKAFYSKVDALKQRLLDEPEQLAVLDQAQTIISDWDEKVVQPMVQLRRKIGAAATMDDMADLVGREKGRKYMDQFNTVMAGFIDEEKQTIATLQAENIAIQDRTYWVVGGVIAVALILGLGLAVLVGNGISGPLVRMTGEMDRLAKGDTGLKIHGTERRDEIGDMAIALRVFRDNARENARLMQEQQEQEEQNRERDRQDAERQQREDEARRQQAEAAERDKHEAMMNLATRFEDSIGSVVQAVSKSAGDLQSAAESMSTTAVQTNSEAEIAQGATASTLENVRSVSEAAANLNGSIAEIARQVTLSTDTASRAVTEAENTGVVVGGLSEMVDKIGDVLAMINDIAAQTNLLALNATIEAARAGEAGKGFAVVASEVKSLAGQTARATEEIASHIAAVQGATGDTVNAMTMIGATISDVNAGISAIAGAVDEQGVATATISDNVDEAAKGSEGVANSIGTVRQAANDSGVAAQQVLSAAEIMDDQAERLQREVDQFLAEVRAG